MNSYTKTPVNTVSSVLSMYREHLTFFLTGVVRLHMVDNSRSPHLRW